MSGPVSPGPLAVKKRTLLAIAGCVWLVAGINVARLGRWPIVPCPG